MEDGMTRRRHDPDYPIDRDGVVVPLFPGVQPTPPIDESTAFDSPYVETAVCAGCGEDVVVGEECLWCED